MCVIMIAEDQRPTVQMIDRAFDWNNDGASAAWREGDGDDKVVLWEKGLMADKGGLARIQELAASLPLPYVLHFRIKTIGDKKPQMTHPFPVDKKTSLALKGKTKGFVLFHNGTWKEWADEARHAALSTGTQIPTGKWMDSRAMAWLCSIYGLGFMEFLPSQRGVAFGPHGMEVFTGDGWFRVNGVWCSNENFLNKSRGNSNNSTKPMCHNIHCSRVDVDSHGWCPLHALAFTTSPTANGSGAASGVTAPSSSPFRPTTPGAIIPLDVAEAMHLELNSAGERLVSKNLIKAIRKAYARMGMGGKDGDKARKGLEMASLLPIFNGRLK